jgi:uncharacterized protein
MAIFGEMEHIPLKDEVWPSFLRDNTARLFKLDPPEPSRA